MQTSLLLRDILSTVEIRGFYQAGDEDDVDVVADVADVNDVDNEDAEDVGELEIGPVPTRIGPGL